MLWKEETTWIFFREVITWFRDGLNNLLFHFVCFCGDFCLGSSFLFLFLVVSSFSDSFWDFIGSKDSKYFSPSL